MFLEDFKERILKDTASWFKFLFFFNSCQNLKYPKTSFRISFGFEEILIMICFTVHKGDHI